MEEELVLVNADKRLTENIIALGNENEALLVASILIKNDYCVMLSKEEDLTIVNYIDCCTATMEGFTPRQDVYFNLANELEVDVWGGEKEDTPFE